MSLIFNELTAEFSTRRILFYGLSGRLDIIARFRNVERIKKHPHPDTKRKKKHVFRLLSLDKLLRLDLILIQREKISWLDDKNKSDILWYGTNINLSLADNSRLHETGPSVLIRPRLFRVRAFIVIWGSSINPWLSRTNLMIKENYLSYHSLPDEDDGTEIARFIIRKEHRSCKSNEVLSFFMLTIDEADKHEKHNFACYRFSAILRFKRKIADHKLCKCFSKKKSQPKVLPHDDDLRPTSRFVQQPKIDCWRSLPPGADPIWYEISSAQIFHWHRYGEKITYPDVSIKCTQTFM